LGRSGLIVSLLSIGLSTLAFRIEGWRYSLRELRGARRRSEAALLSINLVMWGMLVLRFGCRAAGLMVGSQVLSSVYLTAIVAANHRGMPCYPAAAELSFVQRQVLTSRNLTCNPIWDLLYGGLNSQIEHHLFPAMPRPHLARARQIIEPFCASHGLPYTEVSPLSAYRQVVRAELRGELGRNV
jgi:fatty acid desaturase